MKVVIASKNPVKIAATQSGFEAMFPQISFSFEGVSVASNVNDQPMSDEETWQGAKNRAENARKLRPQADFWVGIEGGVTGHHDKMEAFAWMFILGKHGQGSAKTCSFLLPPEICQLIKKGYELGEADDKVFGTANSKQKGGAVGLLTEGVIIRQTLYQPAIILALIPFKQKKLYLIT